MHEAPWKLGDPCYIASTDSGRPCIMPAQVTRISGLPEPHARATSLNSAQLGGPLIEEGYALPTKRAARKEARRIVAERASWLASLLVRIPLKGRSPDFVMPENVPEHGQVVYILDEEKAEVLEVVVGWREFALGRLVLGYDSCPGNPEANMVRINEWWPTGHQAHNVAQERHNKDFAYVSKEEGARRVKEDIDTIWSDAAARLRDPVWKARHMESMREFIANA